MPMAPYIETFGRPPSAFVIAAPAWPLAEASLLPVLPVLPLCRLLARAPLFFIWCARRVSSSTLQLGPVQPASQ